MKDIKNSSQYPVPTGPDFFKHFWEESWIYIKTVVDVVREPVLILNLDFQVMAANESFYQMFKVEPKDTEGKIVYELGNGQWNIPSLKKLLEDILPKNTVFKGFEVDHEFPFIGRRVMLLNARQIYLKEEETPRLFPQIILLAMEDITEMMLVAEALVSHANQLEVKISDGTKKLEIDIKKLKNEVSTLKNKHSENAKL